MIHQNISLKKYNTFGLNYNALRLITVKNEEEAIGVLIKKEYEHPLLIMGGGSNLLFTSDFNGTIIHPEISDIRLEETGNGFVVVSSGSGVNWDEFVEWNVNNGFGGIENLSLIPGLTGAAPVQNIGAYGVEARDTILKVRAVSVIDGSVREFSNDECRFGYRNSIFKGELKGKYLVTRVYFKLKTNHELKLDYGSLNDEISRLGKKNLKNARKAVMNIRQSKLPDPKITGNAGSFFKNPVVTGNFAEDLKTRYPNMPLYPDDEGMVKIAAGWLIEQCGWKGAREGGAAVHEKQALVIINTGNATGRDVFILSENIRKSVIEKFGIELEREVEVIGYL